MKDRFYLACLRDNVGDNVAFHAIDGLGYTTDVRKAHTYTREQAQRAWDNGRYFDLPLAADYVDANTVFKVDMQYIPNETQLSDHETWVAYQPMRYNGNDVYWITAITPTLAVDSAIRFTRSEVDPRITDFIYVPLDKVNEVKRPTFANALINKRKMVQGAGLITPPHIKRMKTRKANPMTRFNCPSCGRINWQHDPHEFHGCSNYFCDHSASR